MLPLRYSHYLATSCLIPTRKVLLCAFLSMNALLWSQWPSLSWAGEPKGPLASFGEKRTFSDKSGKFKIEGKLKFADAKAAQILKPDGKVVTVPFDKLSPADAQFVKAFLSAEKVLADAGVPEEDPDNPFAGGTEQPDSQSSSSKDMPKSETQKTGRTSRADKSKREVDPDDDVSESVADGDIPKRKAKNTGFKPMSIVPAKPFWSAKEPAAFPEIVFEDAIIPCTLKKPFFAKLQVMGAGKAGTLVLNVYQEGKRGESYGKFAVCSATSSEVTSVAEYPDPWKLMAISPDGSRFAAVRVEGFDKGNDVAIFRIADGQIVPEFQFTGGGGSWDELHWMAFLPNNRFATISQKHNFTIWDLENKIGPKALKQGSTGNSLSASMTPAGELMAFVSGNSIAVVETNEGKLVGAIKQESPCSSLAFSSDATMLAAFRPFQVALYSTKDGKEIRTLPVSQEQPNTSLHWFGKNLMVGSTLYDTTTGLPIWNYEMNAAKASLGSYLLAGFGGDEGTSVGLYRLPHDAAVNSSEIDPNTSYALKPGSKVSVEYDFGPTPQDAQAKIREAVTGKIKKLEWVEEPGSDNVIRVAITQGQSDTAEYYTRQGFGPFFAPPGFGPRPSGPSDKVTFTPWTHNLVILNEGKKVFNTTMTATAPQVLQEEKGETTQQTVNRICQPNPDFFKNVSIPPYVLNAKFQENVGKSVVAAEGLK